MKTSKIKKGDIAFVIVIGLITCLVVLVLLASVPIKQRVNKSMNGIRWDVNNSGDYDTSHITMDGYYYNYILELWDSDYYEGSINITGEEEHNLEWVKMFIVAVQAPDGTKYTYASFKEALNRDDLRGYMFMKKGASMSELVIVPSDSKYQYAFPATNLEEAEKLDNKLNVAK